LLFLVSRDRPVEDDGEFQMQRYNKNLQAQVALKISKDLIDWNCQENFIHIYRVILLKLLIAIPKRYSPSIRISGDVTNQN
jgi:hypothetical protein